MIYGKKNFLPPMPLEMGFGVMFRLDDGSVSRHAGERKDKSSSCDETESVLSEAASRYGIEFEGLGLREVDTDDEEEEGEEGGKCESDGEEDEEDEEEKEKGVAAISISARQLHSIPESNDDVDEEEEAEDDKEITEKSGTMGSDAGAKTAKKTGENVNNDEDATNEGKGAGRLTAKERRLLKKIKAKGGDSAPPSDTPKVQTSSGKSKSSSAEEAGEEGGEEGDEEGD